MPDFNEFFADIVVYIVEQPTACFKTELESVYKNTNLNLIQKMDVTVQKVKRTPPEHRVTIIGSEDDIERFISFFKQNLQVTMKVHSSGDKRSWNKVQGEFKKIQSSKYIHTDGSSGESGSVYSHSGRSSTNSGVISSEKQLQYSLSRSYNIIKMNTKLQLKEKDDFAFFAPIDTIRRIYLLNMDDDSVARYVRNTLGNHKH